MATRVLPTRIDPPLSAMTSQRPPASPRTNPFLLVEDDERVARALARPIQRVRPCVLAFDYETAEAHLRSEQRWCGMIFDVRLGSHSGFDLLEIARALHPAVPTLMMSGYHNSTELMNKAYAMGSAYVNKPVGVAEMRRIMSEGLVAEATLDEQVGRTLLRLATSRTLTAAEVEVLVLALEFETGEGILERRGVTRNTHKAQVASLLQKLGVARLTEAARLVFTEAAGDRAR